MAGGIHRTKNYLKFNILSSLSYAADYELSAKNKTAILFF
jgi:hypothetical protein